MDSTGQHPMYGLDPFGMQDFTASRKRKRGDGQLGADRAGLSDPATAFNVPMRLTHQTLEMSIMNNQGQAMYDEYEAGGHPIPAPTVQGPSYPQYGYGYEGVIPALPGSVLGHYGVDMSMAADVDYPGKDEDDYQLVHQSGMESANRKRRPRDIGTSYNHQGCKKRKPQPVFSSFSEELHYSSISANFSGTSDSQSGLNGLTEYQFAALSEAEQHSLARSIHQEKVKEFRRLLELCEKAADPVERRLLLVQCKAADRDAKEAEAIMLELRAAFEVAHQTHLGGRFMHVASPPVLIVEVSDDEMEDAEDDEGLD